MAPLFALSSTVITLLTVLGVIVVLGFWIAGIYNRLVTFRARHKNAFAQIDVQLKRRYDLIPNLVETAKAYMSHERETLEAVINARNQAASAAGKAAANPGDPAAMVALGGAEGMLTQSLGRLFALAEAYPDLKANQNMMAIQEELTSTENKVAFARQAFNDAVTAYNTYRESFPPVLFAGTFGFQHASLLEFDDKAAIQVAPKVSF
ncbi:MAG: LemA family protein [Planctomycetia bacterium]|jgi:LemA protein|nr:LemA family protein [Planctomycetia bacterium]